MIVTEGFKILIDVLQFPGIRRRGSAWITETGWTVIYVLYIHVTVHRNRFLFNPYPANVENMVSS